jgi:sporulation protein YlmC with PRC-barrel domain
MSTRSISGKNLDKAITSDDILGKDVIDAQGRFIGVAEKVFIDSKSLDFIGINIDKGFLKTGLMIGKDYIERVTPHALFLNINVAYELKGKKIFDKHGVLIGKVSDVRLEGHKNQIHSLITYPLVRGLPKKFAIDSSVIENIGYNIILQVTKDEIIEQIEEERKA